MQDGRRTGPLRARVRPMHHTAAPDLAGSPGLERSRAQNARVTKARILVIEDAEPINVAVCAALRDNGLDAVGRGDGRELEQDLRRFRPDLVVLDVLLPGRDGFTLLDVVRRTTNAGVVMLTARDGVPDRLRGLQGGADDYVVKPFVLAELVARVGAVLR